MTIVSPERQWGRLVFPKVRDLSKISRVHYSPVLWGSVALKIGMVSVN